MIQVITTSSIRKNIININFRYVIKNDPATIGNGIINISVSFAGYIWLFLTGYYNYDAEPTPQSSYNYKPLE